MKIAVILLFMGNMLSADIPSDPVQFAVPSELFQGSPADWWDGNSVKLGVGSGMRLQQVYSAAPFLKLAPLGGWIYDISLRVDNHWSGNVVRDMSGLQIWMGTTSLDPVDLKSVFAHNATTELQEVRSVTFADHLDVASDGRQRLGPTITLRLEHPFFYEPNRGNLIFDIVPTGGFYFPLDFHTDGKGEFGSVFADFGSSGYPDSGEVSKGGFVSGIGMNRIPEPGVVTLAALGGAALLAASALRKQTQG